MSAQQTPLLSPVELFNRRLPNRLAVAPMTRVSATEQGLPTARMVNYYRAFAEGGFSIVIAEGTYTDEDASQGYDRQPGIANSRQQSAWKRIAGAISNAGSLAILQLMHAGALSQRQKPRRIIAPSSVQPKGNMMPEYGGSGPFRMPTAMSTSDLAQVRDGFVASAIRARDAGFHGVEIHAANGYLLDQFITEYTNTRDDEYGGSPSARIRFPAEIVAAVREVSPSDFIVGVRVSEAKVNDFTYRWPGGAAEADTIFTAIAAAGASYIHVAGEGRGFREAIAQHRQPLGTVARRVSGLPAIANGGLQDIDLANAAVSGGHADVIAIGRAALANPDFPTRIANGDPILPFDHAMISPNASIANTDAWLASQRERRQPSNAVA